MTRDYSSIYETHDAEMLADADNAITECDLWEWLKNYEPEGGKGFMFSQHPNLTRINTAMKYGGHSGASYGWTMRTMEQIAKGLLTVPTKEKAETPSNFPYTCMCMSKKGLTGWCGVAGGGVPGCEH
jgi:hypothetical protein